MSPHPRDPLPDTPEAGTPAVRRTSSSRNEIVSPRGFEGEEQEQPAGRGWTMEARVTAAALVFTMLGAFGAGVMWVSSIGKDVTELQARFIQHLVDDKSQAEKDDARILALELTQHDSAGDMKVVAQQLLEIEQTLHRIETGAAAAPARRQPRNRPIPAPPRVDER